MIRPIGAVAIGLLLGATAVTSATVAPRAAARANAVGTVSQDVMPAAGGGIEVHVCSDGNEHSPFDLVEFGRSVAGDVGGVQLTLGGTPVDGCRHLVVFTQPVPPQAL